MATRVLPTPPMPSKPPAPRRDNPLARWIKAGVILIGVVFVCWLGVRVLSRKVRDLSPDEIRARMTLSADLPENAKESLENGLPLQSAIEQINRLDTTQRRDVMQSKEAQRYIQRLKPEDRLTFVKETMDRGIRAQIERYRKMTPEEKTAFIEDTKQRQAEMREQLKNQPPEEREKMRAAMGGGNMQEVVERAVQSYLSITSSQERAELAPLFDGALDNLNTARGGG